MKHTNRYPGTLIFPLLIAALLAACGSDDAGKTPSNTAESGTETTPIETAIDNGRNLTADSLPDTLDFEGAVVRIHARTGDDDVKAEFIAEQGVGEIVNDAVYARNMAVEERLNIDIEVLENEMSRHQSASDSYRKSITAGSDDFEIIADGMFWSVPSMLDGMFLDVNTLDYLDLSQPWWNRPFLDMTEYEGKNYMLMGELGQTMVSGAYAIFYNLSMYRELFPDDPTLYEVVDSGTWTMDYLTSLCKDVYKDLNGNGEADDGDRYGNFYTADRTLISDAFVGGCKLDVLEKKDDGTYVFNGNSDRMASYLEKMYTLVFENNHSYRYENTVGFSEKMKNNEIMFAAMMLSYASSLRDMEDDFGIIPMPKLDESQKDYCTYVHDGSTVLMIPTTENEPNIAAATLEAMAAETYRTVSPAYFETALKTKYARNEESSQMLDLIAEGAYLDISIIYGASLPEPINTFRLIFANSSAAQKGISTWAGKEKAMLRGMEKVVEKYAKIED